MHRTPAIRMLSMVLLLGGLASSALAQEAIDEQDGDFDRWVPSVSTGFDVLMQRASGAIETTLPKFPDATNPDRGVRATGTGEFFANPMFGLDAHLTTPAVLDIPGRPRFYLGAGVRYAQKIPHSVAASGEKPTKLPDEVDYFSFDRYKKEIGSPDSFPVLILDPAGVRGWPDSDLRTDPQCDTCVPAAIGGQGVSLVAQAGHFYWQAEVGMVFTIPVGERRLLIKPGVGYFQQEMTMTGKAHRVFRIGKKTASNPRRRAIFSSVELDVRVDDVFHSLGPKVALELDVTHFNSMGQRFGAAIFMDIGAYWMLGDREIYGEASAKAKLRPEDTAYYSLKMATMSYRIGVGFRLSWYPGR